MVNITDCKFYVPQNKKLYRPGQPVQGEVSFVVQNHDAIKVRGIHMYLCGAALTKWKRFEDKENKIGKEIYVHRYQVLFGSKPGLYEKHMLPCEENRYKFKMMLPASGLPSAFEGRYGAIRYWLKLEIVRPFPNLDVKFYRSFTVLAELPVNTPLLTRMVTAKKEKTVSKALGLGDAGLLTLAVTLDRSAYCPGETMLVDLVAENKSSKDLGNVEATLIQVAEFRAGGTTQTYGLPIHTLQSDKLTSGQVMTWTRQPFLIDPVSPSTAEGHGTSHIIKVKYELKVTVKVPLGLDLEMALPVIIGTRPFYSNGDRTKNFLVVKPCTKGVFKFNESDGMFVNLNYQPHAAVVQNYAPPQLTQAPPAPMQAKPQQQLSPQHQQQAPPAKYSPSAPRKPSLVLHGGASARAASGARRQSLRDEPVVRNVPVEPSAPHLQVQPLPFEAPPSYEQVMNQTEAGPDSATTFQEVQTHREGNGAILLLTFPSDQVSSVRQLLQNSRDSLKAINGDLLAFAAFPFSKDYNGAWPCKQSCALFYFWSEDEAELWVTSLSAENEQLAESWSAMVAQNYNREIPVPRAEYKAVTLKIVEMKNLQDKEGISHFRQQYVNDYLPKEKMIPDYMRFIASNKPKFILGNWAEVLNEKTSDSSEVLESQAGQDKFEVPEEDSSLQDDACQPAETFVADPNLSLVSADNETDEKNHPPADDSTVSDYQKAAIGATPLDDPTTIDSPLSVEESTSADHSKSADTGNPTSGADQQSIDDQTSADDDSVGSTDEAAEQASDDSLGDRRYFVSAYCFPDLEKAVMFADTLAEDPALKEFNDNAKNYGDILVQLYFPGPCFNTF